MAMLITMEETREVAKRIPVKKGAIGFLLDFMDPGFKLFKYLKKTKML